MKLIVGLGNPTGQYTYTRHNLGFLVLEALAAEEKVSFRQVSAVDGKVVSLELDGCSCSLLMPTTFMNNSGHAVKRLGEKKGIEAKDILVICDDLSLNFGHLRIKPSGSAGGHNGLKSIIEQLGTNTFARLRMGIGEAKPGMDTADYVLSNFTSVEKKALPDFINQALGCVHSWVNHGVEHAMNSHNKRTS